MKLQSIATALTLAVPCTLVAVAEASTTYEGYGTVYTLSSPSNGNCNFMSWPSDAPTKYAALNTDQWDDTMNCGRCAEVSCTDSSCSGQSSEIVYIMDQCPGCSYGDLDLSPDVFESITGQSYTKLSIEWKFVDCPISNNVQYCLKTGSSEFWVAVQPTNFVSGVESLKINNQETSVIDSAYYFLIDGSGESVADLSSVRISLTGVNGEVLEETLSLTADECTDGSSQFSYSGDSTQTSSETQSTLTSAPTTAAPITATPTPAPSTEAPTTAPVTSAPTTEVPTTAPVTLTTAPVTSAPSTEAPTTAPVTLAPKTEAPTTAPVTSAPSTEAPITAPVTSAPSTEATTTAPAPNTESPTTAPVTSAPSTEPPTSTTPAPTENATSVPTSTTSAPTKLTYAVNSTSASSDDEKRNSSTTDNSSSSSSSGFSSVGQDEDQVSKYKSASASQDGSAASASATSTQTSTTVQSSTSVPTATSTPNPTEASVRAEASSGGIHTTGAIIALVAVACVAMAAAVGVAVAVRRKRKLLEERKNMEDRISGASLESPRLSGTPSYASVVTPRSEVAVMHSVV